MDMELNKSCTGRRVLARAFTLVEILVVIGIIGILAALALGVGPGVMKKRDRSRVTGELNKLITKIENYHSKFGQYPPSNPSNAVTNQLFYELVGTVYSQGATPPGSATWTTKTGNETISYAGVVNYFGGVAFLNTGTNSGQVKSFYDDIKASHFAELSSNPDVEVLIGPVRGDKDAAPGAQAAELTATDGRKVNPWRYNSINPTHNPGKYDLWLEVKLGNDIEIIGNW